MPTYSFSIAPDQTRDGEQSKGFVFADSIQEALTKVIHPDANVFFVSDEEYDGPCLGDTFVE